MKKFDLKVIVIVWVAAFLLAVGSAWLFLEGMMLPGQLNPTPEMGTTNWIQSPATDIARDVHWLWAWTVAIIFPFLFGPILLLLYSMVRFRKSKNPRAATFHENVPLEVFWTVTPALFLVAMAVPAYGVLRKMDFPDKKPDVFVDVVGAQFYWQYSFPRYGVTVTDDGTGEVPLVLPHNKVVYMTGTSHQVNHAWWVPSFGVKYDVIPGRTNYGWFTTEQQGFFKGQCAELCGALHAFMWIHVEVVPEAEFYQWLDENGAEFPLEDREKILTYLGSERAREIFGDAEMLDFE